jgi:hypothetical protein
MRTGKTFAAGFMTLVIGLIVFVIGLFYVEIAGLVAGAIVAIVGLIFVAEGAASKTANIEYGVIIRRPIEDVWSFITDFRNQPKWDEGVCEIIEISPGPIGVGTRIVDRGYGLGYSNWHESFRVIEFVPNHTLVLSWNGSYGEARALQL